MPSERLQPTRAVSHRPSRAAIVLIVAFQFCRLCAQVRAQSEPATFAGNAPNLDVLSAEQWRRIDVTVDRGLDFLAKQQQHDGSFAAPDGGQPGISSL